MGEEMTAKSYHDLVREAKTRVAEVTARESMHILKDQPDTVVVDCREPNEAALGTVAGSVVIPRGLLEQNIERVASRDQKVIVYCAAGNRSALAADTLREMGFQDVSTMAGGFRAWVEAGGEVDA
jgi:rhodanese-related sulfurtransferase